MLFAHFADCHIGGWQDPNLKSLGLQTFKLAVQTCINRNIDFLVISGDLFNTAIPQIDYIKEVASEFAKLKDKSIPVYLIAGSHDYSPSGKTMLDVLEKAKLCVNVTKFDNDKLQFTIDPKTQTKITGLYGKRGGLEKNDYQELDFSHLENEIGFKIFMFHTAIQEFNPPELKDMESLNAASLPKNFNYYAGGHIHYIFNKEYGNGKLTFPGALFPNNFKELEEYKHGAFYLVDENLNTEHVQLPIKEVMDLHFNAEGKDAEQLTQEILNSLNNFEDKIVMLRVKGTLNSGKPSDVNFKLIMQKLKPAYTVLKNTSKLKSKKFEKLELKQGNVKEIETQLIQEATVTVEIPEFDQKELTEMLLNALDKEKAEGEKNADFEKRVFSEVVDQLKLKEMFQ